MMTLAKVYSQNTPIEGYWMSEKLDGVRAAWDGTRLYFRGGLPVQTPPEFTSGWPPFALDGELWTKRGDFENIVRIVRDAEPSADWAKIGYYIFDVPLPELTFAERLAKARAWFKAHPNNKIHIIEQRECESRTALKAFLARVEAAGGEGVMLRDPTSQFEPGRSSTLLKVKSHDDAEATVIGYKPGKGKLAGMVGSLWVEMGGVRFYIGSGLNHQNRLRPPPLGSRVTFEYDGLSEIGKPRFPRFLQVREFP